MNKQRFVIAGVGLAIALVIGLGFLFGVQPQLNAAGAAALQTSTIDAGNQASQAQLEKLKADYANLTKFKDQLNELQQSVPSSPSLDTLLTNLRGLAASTGTTISQFDAADAVAYTPPVAPAASTPTSGSTASPSPTPTPTPTAAAPATPQSPKEATNPLITASNFVAIPVTIGVNGNMDSAIAFLSALQKGTRLVLVTDFSGNEDAAAAATGKSAGGSTASGVTYTIKGLVYVLQPVSQPTPAPTPSK